MALIDERTLRENCRHFSENMDFDKCVVPIIEEVGQLYIKPIIGERLYVALLNPELIDGDTREAVEALRVGGEYKTECGFVSYCVGLNKAIAYYVYARLLRNPNGFLSSTGFRQPVDNYSNYAEYKERESTIIAVKEAADSYMADCRRYISENKVLRGLTCCRAQRRAGGITHVIGD